MSAADERNIQYSPTTDSQEDRWTLQYETNEQQIRDYKRQRDLDEFEIKGKRMTQNTNKPVLVITSGALI